jgi:ribosomal protein L32
MSQPKKKTSPRRRDNRRGSNAHQLKTVSWTNSSPLTQEPGRSHRVTLETVDAYVAARKAKKASGSSKSTSKA